MNEMEKHDPRKDSDPEVWGVLAIAVLLGICCAAVPLIATGGLGLLVGWLTDNILFIGIGLALILSGALLLQRRKRREQFDGRNGGCGPGE